MLKKENNRMQFRNDFPKHCNNYVVSLTKRVFMFSETQNKQVRTIQHVTSVLILGPKTIPLPM